MINQWYALSMSVLLAGSCFLGGLLLGDRNGFYRAVKYLPVPVATYGDFVDGNPEEYITDQAISYKRQNDE